MDSDSTTAGLKNLGLRTPPQNRDAYFRTCGVGVLNDAYTENIKKFLKK